MPFRPLLSLCLTAISFGGLRGEALHPVIHQSSLQTAASKDPSRSDNMTATNPIKLQPIPVAPLQIELRFMLRVPAHEAFDLVTNRLPEWFGAIHSTKWDHTRSTAGPDHPGACSERVCDFGGKALREEIVSYTEGRSYTYRADMERSEMKMPLTDHLGSFEIEQVKGGSVVTWRQYFQARWYMPTFMLRWQMRDRMMRPAVDGLITKFGGEWLSVR